MSRNYAAELAEYAALVAKHPDVGWHLAILDIRVANDIRPAMINVALCESYLMDWLAEDRAFAGVHFNTTRAEWVASGGGNWWVAPTRLLALIAAVEATKGETTCTSMTRPRLSASHTDAESATESSPRARRATCIAESNRARGRTHATSTPTVGRTPGTGR